MKTYQTLYNKGNVDSIAERRLFMFVRRISFFLLRLVLVCIGANMLSLFLSSSHGLAYSVSDPITVLSQTDTVSFPNAIDFQITVRDRLSTITQGTIYITSDAPRYFSESYTVVPAHSAPVVTLRWHEDTSRLPFFPPGSHIKYYWQIQDMTGSFAQPLQQFSTVDTRFSWQHLSQGMVQVNWYNRTTGFGQVIVSQAMTSLSRISNNLGGGLLHPVNLWVYQSTDDFRGSLPNGTSEWVGGIAFPSLDEAFIVVDSTADTTLVREMPHELTHLVFHQRIAQGISSPIWLDEGLAVYNQLYHEPEMTVRLNEALTTHTLLPLQTLYFGFPTNADQAYLAYAQSWNLIDYMYTTFGQNRMHALVQAMNNPKFNFAEDVQQALGVDVLHLENSWRVHLNQPLIQGINIGTPTPQPARKSLPTPGLTDSNAPLLLSLGILLVVLPVCGLIALFSYQHRRRRRATILQSAPQARANGSAVEGYIVPAGWHPHNVGTYDAQSAVHRASAGNPPTAGGWNPYPPSQQPAYPPPRTPAVSNSAYPAPPFDGKTKRTNEEHFFMPFASGQEFLDSPPIQQPPRE
jgi:hypothetical protein